MVAVLTTLIHLTIFSINLGTLYYDVMYITENGERTWEYRGYAGKFKHLTFWNQILQTLYFGFCFLIDISDKYQDEKRPPSKMQRWRDNFAAAIAFPMGTFVVLTFWGLYAVDRELVFPKRLDTLVPGWLNHSVHTFVIVFLLVDKILVNHQYPCKKNGLSSTVCFAMVYQAWIFWIAYYSGMWVYPILAVLDWPKRAAFLMTCWAVLIGIYLTGEKLTSAIWGATDAKKVKTT